MPMMTQRTPSAQVLTYTRVFSSNGQSLWHVNFPVIRQPAGCKSFSVTVESYPMGRKTQGRRQMWKTMKRAAQPPVVRRVFDALQWQYLMHFLGFFATLSVMGFWSTVKGARRWRDKQRQWWRRGGSGVLCYFELVLWTFSGCVGVFASCVLDIASSLHDTSARCNINGI